MTLLSVEEESSPFHLHLRSGSKVSERVRFVDMFRKSSIIICRSLSRTASTNRNFVVKASPNTFTVNNSGISQVAARWSSTNTKEPAAEPKVAETIVDDLGDVIPPDNSDAEKILVLEKEIRDLKDRVVRSLAEEENVRLSELSLVDILLQYLIIQMSTSLMSSPLSLELCFQLPRYLLLRKDAIHPPLYVNYLRVDRCRRGN